ncbi:MAG: acyltransferase family protein, partial [Pyrinomonadaceae bacterium]
MITAEKIGSTILTDRKPGTAAAASRSQTGYVEIISLLRGLSCLAVALFHLTQADPTLFDARVVFVGAFGWYGATTIFFVISGYIIPYSLSRSGYQLRDFGTFVLKRIIRIDPPYLF